MEAWRLSFARRPHVSAPFPSCITTPTQLLNSFLQFTLDIWTSLPISYFNSKKRISVTIRFQPLPSAPILKTRIFKISASQKFETVVKFLRKKLDCKDTDTVFCYVNSVFAPGLDEGVGGLWRVCVSLYLFILFLLRWFLAELPVPSIKWITNGHSEGAVF